MWETKTHCGTVAYKSLSEENLSDFESDQSDCEFPAVYALFYLIGQILRFALTSDLQSAVIRPVVTVWLTWWNKPSPSYALISDSFVTSELLCNASISLYTCKMFAAISVMCLFQLENIPASFSFQDSSCVTSNLLPHATSNFIPSLQLCILNYVGIIKLIASSGNLFSRWHLYTVPA